MYRLCLLNHLIMYTLVKHLDECPQIRDKASIIPLVAGLRREVLNQVSEGMALVWESYKLDPYVQKLSEVVLQFQEKVKCNL